MATVTMDFEVGDYVVPQAGPEPGVLRCLVEDKDDGGILIRKIWPSGGSSLCWWNHEYWTHDAVVIIDFSVQRGRSRRVAGS